MHKKDIFKKELTHDELRQYLRESQVFFEYKKVDGTLRQAWGTLKPDLIPSDQTPKDSSTGVTKENKSTNLRYFDIDKNAWRSVSGDTSLIFTLLP